MKYPLPTAFLQQFFHIMRNTSQVPQLPEASNLTSETPAHYNVKRMNSSRILEKGVSIWDLLLILPPPVSFSFIFFSPLFKHLVEICVAGGRNRRFHCSQVGPHLGTLVPMGTKMSFLVPIWSQFIFKVPIFSISDLRTRQKSVQPLSNVNHEITCGNKN